MSWVGALVEPIDRERSALFGGCFALLERGWFVTADHVLEAAGERGATDLHLIGANLEPVAVRATFRHPMFDLALLHAPHDRPVDAFGAVAAPIVGETVDMISCQGERLETTVTALGQVTKRSTHVTRGTASDALKQRPTTRTYTYPAVMLGAEADHGFSGGPVVNRAGAVVGLVALNRRIGEHRRGCALRLWPALPWIADTIYRNHQEEAA